MPCNDGGWSASDESRATDALRGRSLEILRQAAYLKKQAPWVSFDKEGKDAMRTLRGGRIWRIEDIQEANDRAIRALCAAFRDLTQDEQERILYSDARSRAQRDFANFWEDHDKADRRERKQRQKAKMLKEIERRVQEARERIEEEVASEYETRRRSK